VLQENPPARSSETSGMRQKRPVFFAKTRASGYDGRAQKGKVVKLGALLAATVIMGAVPMLSDAHADDGEINACQSRGIGREPLVQSEATAKEIFLAIARAKAPFNMKRYPIVIARDSDDHWEVTQAATSSSTAYAHGTVTTTSGGGQLSMSINKCNGAVSEAYFNR